VRSAFPEEYAAYRMEEGARNGEATFEESLKKSVLGTLRGYGNRRNVTKGGRAALRGGRKVFRSILSSN
jgi:hypothetical protein